MPHVPQSAADEQCALDPSTLPAAVPKEWKVDREMYHQRWNANIKWPRYCYNDDLKRAVGQCENLDCPRDGPGGGKCIPGFEQAFDWEHVDAKAKKACISELCGDLPADMPEAEWKAKIRAELERGKCRLLCGNCHHLKTHYGAVMRYE